MTVVTYQNLPLADRGRKWDASAAKKRVKSWAGAEEKPNAKYRKAFVWYDAERADKFESYKLPIADVINHQSSDDSGELKAVPKGVFAAAAAVQGARGGLHIPDSDVPGVKRHLDRYYAKMRKEFDDETITAPWSDDRDKDSLSLGSSSSDDDDRAGGEGIRVSDPSPAQRSNGLWRPPTRSLRHVTATPDIEVREVGESGRVRFAGYGVKWGEVATIYDWFFGEFTEEFRKGSWKKTIDERGPRGNGAIKYCRQHNYYVAIAARYLDLREDSVGLFYEAESIDTGVGRDLAEELRTGVINTNSVGWDSIVEEWNREEGHRVIIEAKGYEISAVNWPAYEGATIDTVRALEQLPELLRIAERQLRAGAVPPGIALERMEALRGQMQRIIDATRGAGPGEIPPVTNTEGAPASEASHARTLKTELELIEAELDL